MNRRNAKVVSDFLKNTPENRGWQCRVQTNDLAGKSQEKKMNQQLHKTGTENDEKQPKKRPHLIRGESRGWGNRFP